MRLHCADGLIVGVDLKQQQAAVTRLLCGLAPAQAAARVPSLFSLCAQAQGAAARAACAAAEDGIAAHEEVVVEVAAVRGEAAQEHLWRLLIDWPRELALAPQEHLLARWRRQLRRDAQSLSGADFLFFLETEVLGMAPATWLALRDLGALRAWSEAAPGLAARLCQTLLAQEVALSSAWPEHSSETGAYGRRAGDSLLASLATRPLLARLLARVQELTAMALQDRRFAWPGTLQAQSPAPGSGWALAQTARGALRHEVEVVAGKVTRYCIVAPTDRHFAPRGALAALLLGRTCADQAEALTLARRYVLALDPCVELRISLADDGARARP